jgi:phosphoesterase RecJ-like protein
MFASAQTVLIVSHIRPDGDAVGSLLGLGLALEGSGKSVRMVLADAVPLSFRHLEGSAKIQRGLPPHDLQKFDLVITVDCSDLQRIGGLLGQSGEANGSDSTSGRIPDLNIDHHITNLLFGSVNLVLPEQVATAAIIANHLSHWGLVLTPPVASALLTGIVTDTIGFRTSNMHPDALRLSAMLMEHGAPLPELYTRALVNKSYEAARYWGFGLYKLQREVFPDGQSLVWTSLTLEDRKNAEYPGNDDADLVNILSTIDSDLALIFIEQKNGRVKVSWRARPGYDVSQIALQFGGGGHPAAAGADLAGPMEAVQAQVIEATRHLLVRKVSHGANPSA